MKDFIEPQNSAVASWIIKDALLACAIKEDDPESNSKKYKIYSILGMILTPFFNMNNIADNIKQRLSMREPLVRHWMWWYSLQIVYFE